MSGIGNYAAPERKELGKIQVAHFGLGGYQEAQVGLWLGLGGKGWGVQHGYVGGWSFPPDSHAKWTLETQSESYAKMVRDILELLSTAKVMDISLLVGTPVECTFKGMELQSFRVLTEVL